MALQTAFRDKPCPPYRFESPLGRFFFTSARQVQPRISKGSPMQVSCAGRGCVGRRGARGSLRAETGCMSHVSADVYFS